MTVSDSQQKQLEQAIINGNRLEAYRIYRDRYHCDINTAKDAVEKLETELRKSQPQRFNQSMHAKSSSNHIKVGKGAIIAFLLFDFILFAAAMWWFFLSDNYDNKNRNNHAQPVTKLLPASFETDTYSTPLKSEQTFRSVYQEKINSWSYSRHKNSSRRNNFDDLDEEVQIKAIRSHLAASRVFPADNEITEIAVNPGQQVTIDGEINESEWGHASRIEIDNEHQTTLYLTSDGEWLFAACDAKDEITKEGFDQFRVYLHAGLIPELKNERVHLGRNSSLSSIRQTTFRWQGDPPDSEDERWKKYPISDWGIYRYAAGATQLKQNRQYELAIHMGEAGLHRGSPFTLYIEVETDPLRNEQGKFKKRQYLGYLGNQKEPAWFTIN